MINQEMESRLKLIQIIIMLVDFMINIFTLTFFIVRGIIEGRAFLISFNDITVYGILFLILLGKIFIGTVIFITLCIKAEKHFIKTSLSIIIPWTVLTVVIILYGISLIMNNVYGAKEIFVYILIVSIGIIIWNKVVLYNNDVKRWMAIIYNVFSTAANYLLIIIVYIISQF